MTRIRMLLTILALFMAGVVYAAEPVNINTADASTLSEAIKGVGLKKAQAIVAYRTEHGPFTSIDDLIRISGIGEKIVDDARENITVAPSGG